MEEIIRAANQNPSMEMIGDAKKKRIPGENVLTPKSV
jgi:hypothetical protein